MNSMRRRVLIVEEEPAIRNILYVLLAGMRCDGDAAYSGQQALAKIGRENYDAILLDIRSQNVSVDEVMSGIREIQPNLVGRVLVITGDLDDPKTFELIERNALPHIPGKGLGAELWHHLQSLLGLVPSPEGTP
jgi:DNA-binding NtrC family response regulator